MLKYPIIFLALFIMLAAGYPSEFDRETRWIFALLSIIGFFFTSLSYVLTDGLDHYLRRQKRSD